MEESLLKPKRIFTPEHREKLSAAKKGKPSHMKGKKMTLEQRARVSKAHLGQPSWCKGKTGVYSLEAIQRMRLSHLGKKHTEEQKRKIAEAQMGEKSHFWRGGLIKEGYRSNKAYARLKREIFERDNHVCTECSSNEKLIIDHIKPSRYFPELRMDKNNLRVLCHTCHVKTDTYGIKVHAYGG
jgi:hypothetical protein